MTEDADRQREYDDALAEAVDHVSHTLEAQQEGEERVRKRWLPGLALSLVAFVPVMAWNVWLAARPPGTLPAAIIEGGLRHEVGLLAQEAEAYRIQNGRFPRPEEIAPMLDDVVGYTLGEDGYVITARSGSVRLVYDGSVPVEDWMASR